MSQYKDLSSYKLAVKLRSRKTILVEGVSDKTVLSRFILGKNHLDAVNSAFIIDDVSIIGPDEQFSGLGNRQKLLVTASRVVQPNKIKYFADREWDNIDLSAVSLNCFSQSSQTVLLTKGHSIENYWFDKGAIVSFLIQTHAENINDGYLSEVSKRFNEFLRFSASYSIAAKDSQAITKCGGLIGAGDVVWTGARYEATEDLNLKCRQRRIESNIVQLMQNNRAQIDAIQPALLQWICHGHLGEEAIRACAANLAKEYGIGDNTVSSIERGHQKEKLNHDAAYIAGCENSRIHPLDEILTWVRG